MNNIRFHESSELDRASLAMGVEILVFRTVAARRKKGGMYV